MKAKKDVAGSGNAKTKKSTIGGSTGAGRYTATTIKNSAYGYNGQGSVPGNKIYRPS